MDATPRARVRDRAGNRCENCRIQQQHYIIFNPRTDTWNQPFRIQAGRIIGLTSVGRTTVYVSTMNRPDRVRVRLELEPETFLE